ncbi:hypothetical protein CU098_004167 [Rhizopus stolonifer]|uniref:Uncharacterized protein n=2 Tax=Mucorineae TaxID=1344963 RepID=A0A367J3G6_RHIST|nr:hypothetical protein CU098_004167 [Rhizopus stolonifer]
MFPQSRSTSISSSCSSTKSNRSFWSKISKLFHKSRSSSSESVRKNDNYSNSTLSTKSAEMDSNSSQRRHRKQLVSTVDNASPPLMIPPFSPTYLKQNEFPYSNFYVKLPDGRWMVRYRDGNRDILRTDIMEGYLI